jgi:hypothetical protein
MKIPLFVLTISSAINKINKNMLVPSVVPSAQQFQNARVLACQATWFWLFLEDYIVYASTNIG